MLKKKRFSLGIFGYKVSYQIIFFRLARTFFCSGSIFLKMFLTLSPNFASCLQLLKVILSVAKIVFNIFYGYCYVIKFSQYKNYFRVFSLVLITNVLLSKKVCN